MLVKAFTWLTDSINYFGVTVEHQLKACGQMRTFKKKYVFIPMFLHPN